MPNLIEQMNILRNLGDDQLAAEMQSPSSGVAPFMVASELNRRKDMRDRYQALAANRAPQTTVADDLLSSMGGSSMSPPMGGPGMSAPVGMPGPSEGMPKFASGGIVDALDYGALAKQYTDDLAETAKEKDRAAAMALLAAGAGIMAGGHSNTLQNIGLGINAGLTSYQDQLKDIGGRRTDLMRGVEALAAAQHGDALTRLQLQQQKEIADEQINAPTADEKNFARYQKLTPEEKALWDQVNPNFNPNQLTNDQRIAQLADKIYEDAQKKYPVSEYAPDEAPEQLRKARIEAYQRIRTLDPEYADRWAKEMGIPVGDLVTTDAGGVDVKDPLDLGL